MALPPGPPVDDQANLSVDDVRACLWFVWKIRFKDETAYPEPADLAAAKIVDSFPPRPWGTTSDPNGLALKFVRGALDTMQSATGYRSNIAFSAFVSAFDGGKTWGDYAGSVHAKRVFVG